MQGRRVQLTYELLASLVQIAGLAAAPADDGMVIREIWLLRMRALLARARIDKLGDLCAVITLDIG